MYANSLTKEPSMPQQHHKIDYIEFLTPSTESVKRFYNQVFGWNFIDYGPSYVALKDAGLDGGFDVDKPSPTPLVILYSEDLETSKQAVQTGGAVISVDIFSFPGGRRFHFIDPAGNELAVWSDRAPKS